MLVFLAAPVVKLLHRFAWLAYRAQVGLRADPPPRSVAADLAGGGGFGVAGDDDAELEAAGRVAARCRSQSATMTAPYVSAMAGTTSIAATPIAGSRGSPDRASTAAVTTVAMPPE
ncbi:MAG: hypothetical protein FJZ01_02255, partial [Candidatus Sericytochromatia bacterium]|nr:hypothetical protein [Candidatus Tanganyikabacteria bacterium]